MPSEAVLHQIRSGLDYEQVFAEALTLRGSGDERTAKCIFHEDDTPSMSVNVADGVYFCHGCGAKGDVFSFVMRSRSQTFPEAVRTLARLAGVDVEKPDPLTPADLRAKHEALLRKETRSREPSEPDPVIDEQIVEAHLERLVNTQNALDALVEKRGLTLETVQQWQIGFDGRRYYVPIRDKTGACVNIRRYRLGPGKAESKMISWRAGFGAARLWPMGSFDRARTQADKTIFLMEGEMDCLLAQQVGLNAVTTTGGAGTWREEWDSLFAGLSVVICYDRDSAGRTGAMMVARQLSRVAREVRVVTIPLAEPPGADFTDYIHGHGHTVIEFLALVMATNPLTGEEEIEEPAIKGEPTDLHLSAASRAEYYNKPIRTQVMVSGKTMSPYLIPKSIRMTCSFLDAPMCQGCSMPPRPPYVMTKTLSFESNDILQFVGIPDSTLKRQLRIRCGIPAKCPVVKETVLAATNIEELQLIPEIDRHSDDAPYVTRGAYYVGHGLQSNRSYTMTGLTVPEPQKQLATHLIHSAVPSQSNIDAFVLTPDVIEQLTVFRPPRPGVDALWEHLDTIYEDMEEFTRIYQRRDLMTAVDLCFHSPLTFDFQGERLKRGWIELLVLGDTRTGKSQIVERMCMHYSAGEMTTGENTTLAGLVGGLHQIGTAWALQWGRIPLNDRRLLVIDEAGNLPQDQIARLSSMRSSGVAEIVKVHTERTNARTRAIWISNPRGMKPISSYTQGVLAVKELIGAPEDIARFDMVVISASDDVEQSVVNAERGPGEPQVFTGSLCHQLVMWAWGRQLAADTRVDWAEGAERRVLNYASRHGDLYKFATEVPLVEPNEQRIKLARLAVATATRFFSASPDGQRIVVQKDHVDFAYQMLERLYQNPRLGFKEWAEAQRRLNEISNIPGVLNIITRTNGGAIQLMEQEQFTQRDLSEILGYGDRNDLREGIAKLRTAGFLRRQGSSFYQKTPAAIRWLRNHLNGNYTPPSLLNDYTPSEELETFVPDPDDEVIDG